MLLLAVLNFAGSVALDTERLVEEETVLGILLLTYLPSLSNVSYIISTGGKTD